MKLKVSSSGWILIDSWNGDIALFSVAVYLIIHSKQAKAPLTFLKQLLTNKTDEPQSLQLKPQGTKKELVFSLDAKNKVVPKVVSSNKDNIKRITSCKLSSVASSICCLQNQLGVPKPLTTPLDQSRDNSTNISNTNSKHMACCFGEQVALVNIDDTRLPINNLPLCANENVCQSHQHCLCCLVKSDPSLSLTGRLSCVWCNEKKSHSIDDCLYLNQSDELLNSKERDDCSQNWEWSCFYWRI